MNIDAFLGQLDIIDMEKLQEKDITIIGCGAVGSFSALVLAKMGINKFTLWDGDTVEEHNLSNQFFERNSLELNKVNATEVNIRCFGSETNLNIYVMPFMFKNSPLRSEIILASVDTIEARANILKRALKSRKAKLLIDTRMQGEDFTVLTVNLQNQEETESYYQNYIKDVETVEGQCSAKSIIFNVLMISSLVADIIKKYVNDEPYPQIIGFNFKTYQQVIGW